MIDKKPRVLAICVFRSGKCVLGARGQDDVTGEVFYRPFGGGVEFGESTEAALRREIMEELGQEIEAARLLTVVENIYEFNGNPGHEIVFVYDATFKNKSVYSQTIVEGVEQSKGLKLDGHWIELQDLLSGRCKIYPLDVGEFIKEWMPR